MTILNKIDEPNVIKDYVMTVGCDSADGNACGFPDGKYFHEEGVEVRDVIIHKTRTALRIAAEALENLCGNTVGTNKGVAAQAIARIEETLK